MMRLCRDGRKARNVSWNLSSGLLIKKRGAPLAGDRVEDHNVRSIHTVAPVVAPPRAAV
jgi:hypothetical protein